MLAGAVGAGGVAGVGDHGDLAVHMCVDPKWPQGVVEIEDDELGQRAAVGEELGQ